MTTYADDALFGSSRGHSKRVEIQHLSPQVADAAKSYIDARVVLIWPYSSSSERLSLLLAESDIRLRKSRGQIKVTFRRGCAKEVAKSKVGIGDTVKLGLTGAVWIETGNIVSTPGQKLDWDLEFRNEVVLEVQRDIGSVTNVSYRAIETVSNKGEEPPETPTTNGFRQDRLTSVVIPSISPALQKYQRLASNSGYEASSDPFAEDDGSIAGKGRKRTKFARSSGAWSVLEDEKDESVMLDKATHPAETIQEGAGHTISSLDNEKLDEQQALPSTISHSDVSYSQNQDSTAELASSPLARKVQEVLEASISPTSEAQSQDLVGLMGPPQTLLRPNLHPSSIELPIENGQHAKPRIHPVLSPQLPIISPLIKRPGIESGYFPFSKSRSELEELGEIDSTKRSQYITNTHTEQDESVMTDNSFVNLEEIAAQDHERQIIDAQRDLAHVGHSFEIMQEQHPQRILASESNHPFEENVPTLNEHSHANVSQKPQHDQLSPRVGDHDGIEPTEGIFESEPLHVMEDDDLYGGHGIAGPADEMSADVEIVNDNERSALDIVEEFLQMSPVDAFHPVASRHDQETTEAGMAERQDSPLLLKSWDEHLNVTAIESHHNRSDNQLSQAHAGAFDSLRVRHPSKTASVAHSSQSLEVVQDVMGQEVQLLKSQNEGSVASGNRSSSARRAEPEIIEIDDEEDDDEDDQDHEESDGEVADAKDTLELHIASRETEIFEPNNTVNITFPQAVDLEAERESAAEILAQLNDEIHFEVVDARPFREKPPVGTHSQGDEEADGHGIQDPQTTLPIYDQLDSEDASPPETDVASYSQNADSDKNGTKISNIQSPMEYSGSESEKHEVSGEDSDSDKLSEHEDMPTSDKSLEVLTKNQQIDSASPHRPIETDVTIGIDAIEEQIQQSVTNLLPTPTATQTNGMHSQEFPKELVSEVNHLQTPSPTQPRETIETIESYDENENLLEITKAHMRSIRRVSPRLVRKSLDLKELTSPYFTPRRDREAVGQPQTLLRETESLSPLATNLDQQSHPAGLKPLKTRLRGAQADALEQQPEAIDPERFEAMYQTGLTTSLAYYAPLASLGEYFSQTVDLIAIQSGMTREAQRATKGPRDYYTSYSLVDPSFGLDNKSTVTVEIFRPSKSALPRTSRGDVMILRNFKVQTSKGKLMLISTDSSAWGVLNVTEVDSSTAPSISVSGPPLEYTEAEISFANQLVTWWIAHGSQQYQTRERKRIPDIETHETELKPTSTGVTTRASSRRQADMRDGSTKGDDDKAQPTNDEKPIEAVSPASVRQSSMPPLPVSENIRPRSHDKPESSVHELRDGTKYHHAQHRRGGSLVHELRDGRKWTDE